jgi:secreted trypsin-like serine protease
VKRTLLVLLSLILIGATTTAPSKAVSFPDNPEVTFAQAPFLVSLWSVDPDTYERESNFCSGVLIDNRTFLTAAHCVSGRSSFVVVTNQGSKFERGEVLSVYDFRVHPRYSKSTSLNDIAVGILNFPARYNSKVLENTQRASDFSRTSNQIFGWGLDQNEDDTGFPMSARLNDFSKNGKKYFRNFNIQTQIAAGKYNSIEKNFSGACFGDSGGPLIAYHQGKPSVIGITSYISARGCDVAIPTVFARVKYYLPFIKSSVNSLLTRFNAEETNFPNLNEVSLLPDTDSFLPRFSNEDSAYSTATLQQGGGVSEAADIKSVMLQAFKTSGPEYYDYSINVYTANPIESCIERQKGKWLVQVALDSRQKVDFVFEINPTTGCYTPDQTVYDAETILTTPPAGSVCDDVGVKPWSYKEKDAKTKTKIDSFSFFFFKPCLGTSKKIWIRVEHTVDGRGDIEPGLDMWAGPFSTEPPSGK